MKRTIALLLAFFAAASIMTFSVGAEEVEEGELIIRLYDPDSGEVDPWLANVSDALSITELDGYTCLTHTTWDDSWSTSLSMKRYFEVDWENYEFDRIMFVADIYFYSDPEIDFDASGEFKIKFGDGSDTNGNTDEKNQFLFYCWDMGLVNGWNHLEIPLCELYCFANDTELYTTTDWFCIWLKGTGYTFDVSIARLDIVYTSESLQTETTEEATEAETETEAVTTTDDDSASVTTAENTSADAVTTAESDGTSSSGCGSVVAAVPIVFVLAVTTTVSTVSVTKRRKR
ncbi:MAG: hypothetical protein LUD44_04675 [Firmicutes bacterium]|nr:hypothetical protein [Bacillota bacterium]